MSVKDKERMEVVVAKQKALLFVVNVHYVIITTIMWTEIFKFIVNLFYRPTETQQQGQSDQQTYTTWQNRPPQQYQVYIFITSTFSQILLVSLL